MTLGELKAEVEAYRQDLQRKTGNVVTFSESGPVGMVLIDKIVSFLDAQQQRINDIEKKINGYKP